MVLLCGEAVAAGLGWGIFRYSLKLVTFSLLQQFYWLHNENLILKRKF